MKKLLSIIMIASLMLFTCVSASAAVNETETRDAIGMSVMGFSATELHGGTVTSDIIPQTTMTVINEWATWCGPCLSEMPHFQTVHEYYSETPEADVQILGCLYIASGGTPSEALNIMTNNGYTWPCVVEDNVLAAVFNNSSSIPNTIIVDRNGIVRDMHIGSFSSAAQLQNYIEGWLETLEAEEPEFIPGDVDGNGEITVADALMIMRAAMNIAVLQNEAAADMNGNGIIEVTDAIVVLRMAMGIA